MRFRFAALLLFITAVSLGNAYSQQTGTATISPEDPDRYKYVVRRGDTLWDLAARFFDDPYEWPLIWEQNRQIEDPHWIYPGDVLTIIPESVLRQMKIASLPVNTEHGTRQEGAMVYAPTIAAERAVTFTPAGVMGFMGESEIQNTVGTIYDSPLERRHFGEPDLVYVSMGEGSGIKLGDRFTVFRPEKKVKNPSTGKVMGSKIRTIGTLEIVAIYPSMSTARIIYSNEDAIIGDKLMPQYAFPQTVHFQDSPQQYHDQPLEAQIIMSRLALPEMGREEIAYINVGKKDGIEPGVLFQVYKPGKSIVDPETKKKHPGPDEDIGEVVVLIAGEEYSTVFISRSKYEFEPGEHVRTKRFQ